MGSETGTQQRVDPAELVAAGPRAAGNEDDYRTLMHDILAGASLHYAGPAVDSDLSLLQGDERYARGLSRLAELGDLEATAELADLISLIAQANAAGDAALADAVWEAGAVAIGWGTSESHEKAKRRARAGLPAAAEALLAAARERRRTAG